MIVLVYFAIGVMWTLGVVVARAFDGFRHYPRAWVWVPLTLLVWPISIFIAACEFVEGFREGMRR